MPLIAFRVRSAYKRNSLKTTLPKLNMQTDGCQFLNLFTFFSFINCWKSGWFQVEHFARYCQFRTASECSRKKTTKNDKLLRHGQTDIHREKKVLRLDSSRKFLWTLVRRKDTWGLSHSPLFQQIDKSLIVLQRLQKLVVAWSEHCCIWISWHIKSRSAVRRVWLRRYSAVPVLDLKFHVKLRVHL